MTKAFRVKFKRVVEYFSRMSFPELREVPAVKSHYQRIEPGDFMTDNKQHQAPTANQPKPQEHDHGSHTGAPKPGDKGGDQTGKDTDNDGRPVQPGHKPGEVDGDKQKRR
jgi:hypothetical protein